MEEKIKLTCPTCAATNLFPVEATGKKVVCGKCKAPLPPPGTPIEPTPEQFQLLYQKSGLPLLVDFYSPTCAPCHMMEPVINNLALRRQGELMIVKINVDYNPQIAAMFGIMGVPTFVILSRGNERGRVSGAQSETDFSLWVASFI